MVRREQLCAAKWLVDKLPEPFYSTRHRLMKGHNSAGMNRKSVQAAPMLGHFSKSDVLYCTRCRRLYGRPSAISSKGVKSASGALGCLLASAACPTTAANVA